MGEETQQRENYCWKRFPDAKKEVKKGKKKSSALGHTFTTEHSDHRLEDQKKQGIKT